MDAEVWRHMPPELIPLILAHLPWWSNLQLRGVCKSWHTFLSTPTNVSYTRPLPHSLYGILSPGILSTSGSCAMVNVIGKHYWNTVPRPSCLPNFWASDFFELQAASSGLLLMEGKLMEVGRILFNPVNKTHRKIPPVPSLIDESCSEGYVARGAIKEDIQGMTGDIVTGKVRIIALQRQPINGHVVPSSARNQTFMSDLELWRLYMYDIDKNAWDLVSRLESEHLQRIKNAILVRETLYILTKQPCYGHRHRHRVFKALANSLVEVPAEITINIPDVHLFEHRRRLMLVGGSAPNQDSVNIWRLDEEGQQWEKIMSVPDNLLYSGRGQRYFKVDAEGDYCCMASKVKKNAIVIVNLVEKTWESVDCKTDLLGQEWQTLRPFLWQPRLSNAL